MFTKLESHLVGIIFQQFSNFRGEITEDKIQTLTSKFKIELLISTITQTQTFIEKDYWNSNSNFYSRKLVITSPIWPSIEERLQAWDSKPDQLLSQYE